jgi:hypothetical protein
MENECYDRYFRRSAILNKYRRKIGHLNETNVMNVFFRRFQPIFCDIFIIIYPKSMLQPSFYVYISG